MVLNIKRSEEALICEPLGVTLKTVLLRLSIPATAERAMRTAITIDSDEEMIGLKRPRLIQVKLNKLTTTVGITNMYRSDVCSIRMMLKPVSKQITGASIIASVKNGLINQ